MKLSKLLKKDLIDDVHGVQKSCQQSVLDGQDGPDVDGGLQVPDLHMGTADHERQ